MPPSSTRAAAKSTARAASRAAAAKSPAKTGRPVVGSAAKPAHKRPATVVALPTPQQPSAIGEFVPADALQNAIRFWWLVVVLMVAGGLVGWGITRVRPGIYEAVVQYGASIDYVQTGPLTQFEEDTAYNLIGGIIYSTDVIQRVIAQATAEGLTLSDPELRGSAFIERRFNVWVLRVRDRDPARAERIANLWIEQARQVITERYQHSLLANQLDTQTQSLEKCLLQAVTGQPAYGLCDRAHVTDIQQELQSAGSLLYNERIASKGIFPGLIPGKVDLAVVSNQPVADQQNQFVLAGALLGLLLAVALIELGLPARWTKRR